MAGSLSFCWALATLWLIAVKADNARTHSHDESIWSIHSPCEDSLGSTCQDLQDLIPTLRDGGKVYLSARSQNISFLGCKNITFTVSQTLELIGNGTKPLLGCLGDVIFNGTQSVLSFKGDGNTQSRLVLKNLSVQYIKLFVSNLHVEIIDCSFEDVTFQLITPEEDKKRVTEVEITQSRWSSTTHCSEAGYCYPSSGLSIVGNNFLRLRVSQTLLLQQPARIILNSDADVLLQNIHSSHDASENPLMGGVAIEFFSPSAQQATVILQDSILDNQHHWHPVSSVVNLFEGAFYVERWEAIPSDNITIFVQNCTFFNNERALTFDGTVQQVEITDCLFDSNIAMHHGGAVYIYNRDNRTVLFRNCTFANNAAGRVRVNNVEPHFGHMQFTDNRTKSTAKVDSEFAKGYITFIGRGGAVRIERGNVTFDNCSFFNNTASIEGGALFVHHDAFVDIINCHFANTPNMDKLSKQGDILFSLGVVSLHGIHIEVHAISDHVSLVQHRGQRWSISLNYITIQCPEGHWVIQTSDFSYKESPAGLIGSYKLDELRIVCESCAKSTYSIQKGSLNYSVQVTSETYVALTTSKVPDEAFGREFYKTVEKHDIECKTCPYGGKCETGLQATPNFWGYVDNLDVKFHVCPSGYCCEKAPCESYHACAEHRTGTLCGNCIDGYTEALYSTKCVPNEHCGHTWIWIFAAGSGIMFVTLLIFQQDIRSFIFTLPTFSKCRGKSGFRAKHRQAKEEEAMGDETVGMKEKEEEEAARQSDGCNNELARKEEHKEDSDSGEWNLHTDIGEVLLIIIMYYFQDAMLFRVQTAFSKLENETHENLQTVLLSLFDFQLDATIFVDNACLMSDLSPVQKLLLLTLNVPFVLLLFAVVYIFYIALSHYRRYSEWNGFLTRLSSAFMLGLLFTYQQLATAAFTVLSCVPVGNQKVLFIEGSVVCYQWWQYALLLYVISCVVPFFIVLLLGPSLLLKGKIGLKSFFVACLFPVPFLLYWLILRLTKHKRKVVTLRRELTPECEAILNDLQGPFRDLKVPGLGRVCWSGVEVFRRLLLVLLYTFISHSLIRTMAMLIVSFLTLFHYVCVQPYNSTLLNFLGSLSFSALLIIGGINFTYAAFDSAEYIPKGPNMKLVEVMQDVESVLLLWFPLAIMIIILIALVFKIVYSIAACILSCIKG